jgi:hypothetical protein
MRRREFIALFGAGAVWPRTAHAQQPPKIRRIGYLDYGAGTLPSGGFAPSMTPIGADLSWRDCGNVAGSRDKMSPLSDDLRRAWQIGSLHLPPNSLPLTSM